MRSSARVSLASIQGMTFKKASRKWSFETAAREGRYEEEGWRVRKDGSRFWASVVITGLRDQQGNLRGYGKVTRDLSERRLAEEILKRQSQEIFDMAVVPPLSGFWGPMSS